MKNKRSQDLPVKTIIIVIIAIVVLALIIIGMITGFGRTGATQNLWWGVSSNIINNSSAEAAQAVVGG